MTTMVKTRCHDRISLRKRIEQLVFYCLNEVVVLVTDQGRGAMWMSNKLCISKGKRQVKENDNPKKKQ
jgi:hypothetical protein